MTREEKIEYVLNIESALDLLEKAQGLILMNDYKDGSDLLDKLNDTKESVSNSFERAVDDVLPRHQVIYSVIVSDFEGAKCHSSWVSEEDAQLVADLYKLKDDEQSVAVEEMKVYGVML